MIYLNNKGPAHQAERGQSLVELSLSFVLLLVFLLGVLDLGRVYFMFLALEDGAGEAAIYLAINPSCPEPADTANPTDPSDPCRDPYNAKYRAAKSIEEQVNWDEAEVTVDYITGGSGVGNRVKVTIYYNYRLLTPIINQIVGEDTLRLNASATQTIMIED